METDLIIDMAKFERDFLDALARRLNEGINRSVKDIRTRVGEQIDEAIRKSPECDSLLSSNGVLHGELGVLDGARAVDEIIRVLTESMRITPIPVVINKSSMTGGLRVEIIKTDYSDVLGLPEASFISEKLHEVDWLKWLLIDGGEVIVGDYRFLSTEGLSRHGRTLGRTGLGIMIPHGTWSMPSEFAGTADDNWLTRAIKGRASNIMTVVLEEVKRNL